MNEELAAEAWARQLFVEAEIPSGIGNWRERHVTPTATAPMARWKPALGWRGAPVLAMLAATSAVLVVGLTHVYKPTIPANTSPPSSGHSAPGPIVPSHHSPTVTLPTSSPGVARSTQASPSITSTPPAGTGQPQSTTQANCFSKPGSCGYPDPAYSNVGVPTGTALAASGSIVVTTQGAIVANKNINGSIEVTANNVTIENTKVTYPAPGCGSGGQCGNSDIKIDPGVSGTRIQNVEVTTAPGATVQFAISNQGSANTYATGLYLHGPDTGWNGPGDVESSYVVTTGTDGTAINYGGGAGTLIVNHDTLLSSDGESAIYASGDQGNITTMTITNNLLAGGGWTVYGGVGGGGSVTGPVSVTGNRFARCLSTSTYNSKTGMTTCQDGPDSHGYFPNSGSYGPTANFNMAVTTMNDNYWDDNLKPIS